MKKLYLIILILTINNLNAQVIIELSKDKKEIESQTKTFIEEKSNRLEQILINEEMDKPIENSIEDFPHFSPNNRQSRNCKFINQAIIGVHVKDANGNNGATITEIISGTGAQKGGLFEGDLILKVNKTTIANSDELIEAISSKEPGDKIKLLILRNGETLKKSIQLTAANNRCRVICFQESNKCKGSNYKCEKETNINSNKPSQFNNTEHKKIVIRDLQDTDSNLGGNSLSVDYLSGSPNPNLGVMVIEFNGDKAPFTIRVIDLTGKELFKETIEDNSGQYKKEISLSKANGTIVIQAKQGKKLNTAKIIVQ